MADGTIDTLQIQIASNATKAIDSLNSLQDKLGGLNAALSSLNTGGLSSLASGVEQLSRAMSAFKSGEIKTADFTRITNGLNKLKDVNVQGVASASGAISVLADNLSKIGTIAFDANGIANLANGIAKLGRVSVTEATQNLEFLKTSLAEFVSGMNSIGSLSFGTENLYKLVSSVSRLGSVNATQSVKNLPQISGYLREFVTSMNSVGSVSFKFDGLEKLVANISRLGGAKATQSVKNLEPIKRQLLRFIDGLNGIGALKFDMAGLNELVGAISRLGGKAATNAVPNIQALGTALRQLMATLSTAPRVSQNLIDMTNAMANLARNGTRAGTASRHLQNSLNRYNASTKLAARGTKSLASQIGMLYAKYFLLLRVFRVFGKAVKSAMDYVEVLNYTNAAFNQVASKADVSDWQKYGYKSAEAYASSFEARSKQLTQKMTGFNVDESGELTRTGMPSLGLDPSKVMQYQATFAQMASSMGVASEQSLKLSNALTMIGADLASVRNMKFEDVWRDMSSGMVGMSRTLDKYGVNIRNVNLQQELYNLGIDRSIAKLNQQDKAVLRTIVLLNSTQYAWGDLANTINQPANQLRLLQSSFSSLGRTIGSLFIPIITKVLPYINALVIALQRLFAWIGGLLGIKLSNFTSSVGGAAVEMGDFADSADGAAGSLGDANKEAKKLKGNLQSFDELNTISIDNESGGGGGAAGGGGAGGIPELNAALDEALAEYQAAWDKAFSGMENRANELADNVVGAFKRIADGFIYLSGIFKKGFWEGLGDTSVFDSIRKNFDDIGKSLKEIFTDEGVLSALNNLMETLIYNAGQKVGAFVSIGATIIDNITTGTALYLEGAKERIKEYLIDMFDITAETDTIVTNFTTALADIFTVFRSDTAKQITADIIQIFSDGFMGVTELVAKFGRDFLDMLLTPITENTGKIKDAIAGTLKPVETVMGTIAGSITESFERLNQVYDEHLKPTFDSITSGLTEIYGNLLDSYNAYVAPTLDKLATRFSEVWESTLQPIINNAIDLIGSVGDLVKSVWENNIMPVVNWMSTNIMPVLSPIIDALGSQFLDTFEKIGQGFNGFLEVAKGVVDFLAGTFAGDWQKMWVGVKEVFKGIWDGMPDFVKGPIRSIIDFINDGLITGIESGINGVINALNKIKIDIPATPFNDAFTLFDFGLSTVNLPRIPELANGMVVPANMKKFLAILGDNNQETEVVSPLSTIKAAVADTIMSMNYKPAYDMPNYEINYHVPAVEAPAHSGMAGSFAKSYDSSGIEAYAEIRRQNELLEEQNHLLQQLVEKPVIDKNDVGGAYISYAKDYRKQTGKQLGISY